MTRREIQRITALIEAEIAACEALTRSDGKYFVIYLPRAGTFSLVIETGFGPAEMGVHGRAIDCFVAV